MHPSWTVFILDDDRLFFNSKVKRCLIKRKTAVDREDLPGDIGL